MNRLLKNITLFALFVCGASSTGIPHLYLERLCADSDVVVVGIVMPPKAFKVDRQISLKGTTVNAKEYVFEVHTLRPIKGNVDQQFKMTVTFATQLGYELPRRGIRLLFLRRDGEAFTPTNMYYPDLPAAPEACNVMPDERADLVYSKLMCEISAVLAAKDLAGEKYDLRRISYALPKSKYLDSAMQQGIRSNTDEGIRKILQYELLMRNNIAPLREITAELLAGKLTSTNNLRASFLNAISNGIKTPDAIPELRPLLASSDAEIRIAAAQALWHIADRRALGDLAAELQDPNPEVRYYGVRGLAETTGQLEKGPSPAEWQARGGEYLDYWREWVSKNVGQRN